MSQPRRSAIIASKTASLNPIPAKLTMMLWNAFAIALREIRRNLTRAFLTVLGIVIGVAAVITMVTLGQGATLAVKAQISSLGSNLLTLRPGAGFGSRGPRQALRPSRRRMRRSSANRLPASLRLPRCERRQ